MPYIRNTDFNPRSPCGERLKIQNGSLSAVIISIHAPRVGSDAPVCIPVPTGYAISIHAPRVGSDICHYSSFSFLNRFQSTLPVWGATLKKPRQAGRMEGISIHAPRVGSDCRSCPRPPQFLISIHAPRVGSDLFAFPRSNLLSVFQSTLPVWGATFIFLSIVFCLQEFQSTLPVWGATSARRAAQK